jgi:hypothetical protein
VIGKCQVYFLHNIQWIYNGTRGAPGMGGVH